MATDLDTILHGDCVTAMQTLPAGLIDLAFADPPFNIGYEYDVYKDKVDRHVYLEWSRKWISEVFRVLKTDGTFWLAIGDEYAAELKILCQEIGFHSRSWVIWYYTFGVNCKQKFTRSHTHLLYFVKDPTRFTFRGDDLENRIPSARQLVYADNRANPKGRLPDDTWILRPQDLGDCFTQAEDTWYFPRVAGTFKQRAGFHGCQMPEQLLGRIIRLCSREGELVFDPFSGSASTLVTAKKLQRRFLGCELSVEYVTRGLERLDAIRVGDSLEGAAEPTMSAPATPLREVAKKNHRSRSATTPYDRIRESAVLQRDERSQQHFFQELLDAFQESHAGFSLDRVICDPELNNDFAASCESRGLPGDSFTWNHTLIGLRKKGALTGIETSRRTEVSWDDSDPFLFASEIAWRKMFDAGHTSLDGILCDPEAARQFDAFAAELAPGETPLRYRWGALMLRKQSHKVKLRAALLKKHRSFTGESDLDEASLDKIPVEPAVYLLVDGHDSPVYVGETLNLRRRIRLQLVGMNRGSFRSWEPPLRIKLFTSRANVTDLLAYQNLAVKLHQPALNLVEFSA